MVEPQLTQSASERLEQHTAAYREMLLREARRQAYIPGESVNELTGSDIERAVRQLRIVSRRVMDRQRIVLMTYAILGAFGTLIGLFVGELRQLFATDPVRVTIVLTSALLSVLSILMLVYRSARERDVASRYTSVVEAEPQMQAPQRPPPSPAA